MLGKKIIVCKNESNHTIQTSFGHGLVGTALEAYNQHCELILKPDDIWICVMNSFSNYVENHSEEMRHIFVNHSGKEHLIVYGGGTIITANYQNLVQQMIGEMQKHIQNDILHWAQCDFSTTTDHAKFVSQMLLMGSMKSYFTYEMVLFCGLPKVTLLGYKEDWLKLKTKILQLKKFQYKDLDQWSDVMVYVLDQMIRAFDGHIDKNFWNHIASKHEPIGSGSSTVQGWITAFCGFSKSGKYILKDLPTIRESNHYGELSAGDMPSGLSEIPVTINDNGTIHDTTFYAGSLLTNVVNKALNPSIDWAIVE